MLLIVLENNEIFLAYFAIGGRTLGATNRSKWNKNQKFIMK
jgi:hypothetical protein